MYKRQQFVICTYFNYDFNNLLTDAYKKLIGLCFHFLKTIGQRRLNRNTFLFLRLLTYLLYKCVELEEENRKVNWYRSTAI